MNLPNQLTTSRFLMTFALLGILFSEMRGKETLALGIFVVAGFTDWLDGQIARRRKLVTNFGILMDPLADKVLTCSVFIAFVGLGHMPAWMAIVIVARELAITGLRLLAASKSIVLAAEKMGKHKTTSQIVSIIAVLISMSYPTWGEGARQFFEQQFLGWPWASWFTEATKWWAVTLTLVSGSSYLWRNRQIYLSDS